MKKILKEILSPGLIVLLFFTAPLSGQSTPPVCDEAILQKIADEVSGSICFEHIRIMTTLHRIWGSDDYHKAAEYFIRKSKEWGLKEAEIEKYPVVDTGEKFRKYIMGRPFLWNLKKGELRLVKPYPMLITHSEYAPSSIARGSHSTDTTAELVDVGRGDSEKDYEGNDIKGKLVLGDHIRHHIAVHQFGALGTINFTNWAKYPEEDTAMHNMPIWAYQDPAKEQTFGFNISRIQGLFLRELLEKGEKVVLSCKIEAEVIPDGAYELATAIIPGTEAPEEEFIFYAHLDHSKPGAHDNASGDAVIMEIARTLSTLIQKGLIPPPKRTIRFMWIPHTRGLEMYFYHHPEKIGKVKGGCNLDCVGADPVKYPLQFYVALPPYSIPNYLMDIANNMIDYFMQKITKGIYGGPIEDVLYALEGSRNMFSIVKVPARGGGSDQADAHSFPIQVPSVYFYDWPYPPRHSQINFLEYMDRTNLRRISYLGAIISYTFASADEQMAPKLWNEILFRGKARLLHELVKAQHLLETSDSVNLHFHYQKGYKLLHWGSQRENEILHSSGHLCKENQNLKNLFGRCEKSLDKNIDQIMNEYQDYYFDKCKQHNLTPQKSPVFTKKTEWDELIPVINPEMKTFPGCGQRLDYFNEKLGIDVMETYPGIREAYRSGSKALKDYLNYIDGKKTIRDIYEAVQAELWSGDYKKRQYLSYDETVKFLKLLKDVNIISFKKK